ncbi:hypothetical protein H4R34_005708, partial [Dimargaris verticillata]
MALLLNVARQLWRVWVPLCLLCCWALGVETLQVIPSWTHFGANGVIVIEATNQTLVDRAAAFGPSLPKSGLAGHVQWVGDLDPANEAGCRPLTSGRLLALAEPWIALVTRGECSFINKIRAMQLSGAQAVIVGDPRHDTLVTMYASGGSIDITIPSVFIARTQFNELKALLALLPRPVRVRLVRGQIYTLPLTDVILVTLLSPTVMLAFVYLLYRIRRYQQRRRDLAPVEVVASLPTKTFFVVKRLPNEPDECVICLDEYVDEDELR